MKKLFLLIGLFFILAFIPAVFAIPGFPHEFCGDVNVNNTPAPDGTLVSAIVTGKEVLTNIQNPVETTDGSYGKGSLPLLVQGELANGDTVKFLVNGVDAGETFIFTYGGGPDCVDLSVGKQAIGKPCSLNTHCNSDYCSGGVCATEVTGGGGSSGGSSSGGSTTPTTTTETYSSIDTPSASEIRELLASTGLSTSEIQAYVDEVNSGQLSISTTLNVVKTGTGSSATYKSTFTITIRNNSGSNMEDITIVEVIPKNIASDASQITSLTQFRVLVADPVIEFIIPSLNAGQTGTISYSVNDNVTEAEFQAMSGAVAKGTVIEATPTPVTEEVIEETDTTPNITPDTGSTDTGYTDAAITKKSTAIYWIIGIVILAVVGFFLFKENNNKRNRL